MARNGKILYAKKELFQVLVFLGPNKAGGGLNEKGHISRCN